VDRRGRSKRTEGLAELGEKLGGGWLWNGQELAGQAQCGSKNHLGGGEANPFLGSGPESKQNPGQLLVPRTIDTPGPQVVVGRGARVGDQTVGHPHGDLLGQGLHQVGVLRRLSTHGLDNKFLLSSDEPNSSIVGPKIGKLDLYRHLVHDVGGGLLVGDLLVVGTCHLRNFGPLVAADAGEVWVPNLLLCGTHLLLKRKRKVRFILILTNAQHYRTKKRKTVKINVRKNIREKILFLSEKFVRMFEKFTNGCVECRGHHCKVYAAIYL